MKPRFRTEREFQAAFRRRLDTSSLPARWDKIHGSPYQTAGIADLIGCVNGVYVALEFKRAGEKPTPLQDAFLKSVARARGFAAVVAPDRLNIYPVVGGAPTEAAILVMRIHREVTST